MPFLIYIVTPRRTSLSCDMLFIAAVMGVPIIYLPLKDVHTAKIISSRIAVS